MTPTPASTASANRRRRSRRLSSVTRRSPPTTANGTDHSNFKIRHSHHDQGVGCLRLDGTPVDRHAPQSFPSEVDCVIAESVVFLLELHLTHADKLEVLVPPQVFLRHADRVALDVEVGGPVGPQAIAELQETLVDEGWVVGYEDLRAVVATCFEDVGLH